MVSVWPTATYGSRPSPGLATYTCTLSRLLGTLGLRVRVLANSDAVAYHSGAVTVVPTWRPNSLWAGFRIFHSLRNNSTEIVHVQHELFLYGSYLTALAFPVWLARISRKFPTAITVHGVPDPAQIDSELLRGRFPPWLRTVAYAALRYIFHSIVRSDAHKIVHTESLRERLIKYGAAQHDISVIPHPLGGRLSITRDDAREKLGIDRSTEVVLSWGFDNSYKGTDLLVSGFSRYHARALQFGAPLLILGIGPHPKQASSDTYMTKYTQMANRLSANPGVRFVGFIPDDMLDAYVAAADVAVFAYTRFVAASGPMCVALGKNLPILVSEHFVDVSDRLKFASTEEGLAAKLAAYFVDRKPVELASRALAQDSTDDEVAKMYDDLYRRLSQKLKKVQPQNRTRFS